MKSREAMIRYLARETRYIEQQLSKMSTERLTKWYKEEKECNAE